MINEEKKLLIENIDKIHTTTMGVDRIKNNLDIDVDDVVKWCKMKIISPECKTNKKGKNWYANIKNYVITVNAHSYTIITAHKL